jgi:hypothetical protein
MSPWFHPQTISGELHRRNITLVLHSTHLYKNLPQILECGSLLTVRDLRARYGESAGRFLHDPFRYEQFTVGLEYLNASITLPNAPLLYHRSKSNWQSEWVHFALDLALVTRPDTLFCPVSAATDKGQHVSTGYEGFLSLFDKKVGDHTRKGLRPNIPTHPQAEVLIRGSQLLSNIQSIIVAEQNVADEVLRLCELYGHHIDVEISPQLFVWPERLIPKT